MSKVTLPTNFVSVFSALTEIPLRYQDKADVLKRITELGKELVGSDACTLMFVNLAERYVTLAAYAGFDEEYWNRLKDKRIPLSPAEGAWIDYEIIAQADLIEVHDLRNSGGRVANPHTAKRYNLYRVLGCPIKSRGQLIGYFNQFSTSTKAFTESQKEWVEVFTRQAEVTIERFEQQQTLLRSLKIINDLSRSTGQTATGDFMKQLSKQACELLSVPVSILWKPDKAERHLRVIAATGAVDDDYRRIKLDVDHPAIKKRLQSRQAASLSDVQKASHELLYREEMVSRGWVSLMTAPMYVGERLIGMLDIYTYEPRIFTSQEKELFSVFAAQAAMFVQKAELLMEAEAWHERYVILSGASETPGSLPQETEVSETLNLIVRACAETRAAIKTCSLWLWNRATDRLEIQTIYDKSRRKWDLSSIPGYKRGEGICGRVTEAGKCCICRHELEGDCFQKFDVGRSALCVPIKTGGQVIGAVCLGSEETDAFAEDDKFLMENIVQSVPVAIQRAGVRDGELRLAKLTGTSKSMDSLLKELVRITCDLMREPICLLWLLDKDTRAFIVKGYVVPEGQEKKCEGLSIPCDGIGTGTFLKRNHALYVGRPGRRHPAHLFSPLIKSLEWGPMLAMPLNSEEETVGILAVFSHGTRYRFEKWPRRLFSVLGAQAASAITDHLSHQKLHVLSKALRELTEAGDEKELLRVALGRSLELVRSSKGWISRLDLTSGRLNIVEEHGGPSEHHALKIGDGITGKSLIDNTPQRAGDVRMPMWKGTYREYWKDTRAELAVPILVRDVAVRLAKVVQRGAKPLGVLNVESPTVEAFSKLDEDCLSTVADEVAVILDKLESDWKLQRLREVEARIIRQAEWRGIFEVLMAAIRDILGFHYVNVSLIDHATNQVRTEFYSGMPEAEVARFKSMAAHPLDGASDRDIQADIINSRDIEVLDKYDPRCDRRIFEAFGHEKLIRVFMPIVVPLEDRVIGTVETGYDKGYRKFIYERDVQILKGLVEYAAVALQQRRRGLFQRTMHEIRNPTIGIRNHAIVLAKRFPQMDPELVTRKLEDILTDCGTLLYQIGELEHFLGGSPPSSGMEKTIVFRDVIIKVINQLKREVVDRGFDTRKISYDSNDIGKLNLYIDKLKLSQVVYNVLVNAIKYADPATFAIRIAVDEDGKQFIIKFKDWGIGIKKEYENRIFDEGFRAPEAIKLGPTGSGLGLTISLEIMRAMGGDLRLAGAYKPTEFHLILPKRLKERPDDSVRR